MSAPQTIVIVEDELETRERLAGIVETTPGLELAADFAELRVAMRWLDDHEPPAVLLVDLGLPDGDGIDLIRHGRRLRPAPEIMVISVFGDERHVVDAIAAGAGGYLLKDADAAHVGGAILKLLAGESPISSSIARHLLRRFQHSAADADAPRLTPREVEVLRLVGKGFSYIEIANALGMSANTVTSHIKHIYRKLEVRSRGEAVFEALQLGLIDPPR